MVVGESVKVISWFFAMLDVTLPGATSMTLTPNGLHSIARPSEMEWRAALAAQYRVFHGVVLRSEMLAMLMPSDEHIGFTYEPQWNQYSRSGLPYAQTWKGSLRWTGAKHQRCSIRTCFEFGQWWLQLRDLETRLSQVINSTNDDQQIAKAPALFTRISIFPVSARMVCTVRSISSPLVTSRTHFRMFGC